MNAINLITSTLALGTMMGITGTHFHQVQTMMEQGGTTMIQPIEAPATPSPSKDAVLASTMPISLTSATTGASKQLMPPTRPTLKAAQVSLDERESALMEILREIRTDQKNIRSQLSETNRDMDELSFRVDTHSTQFRPMKVESVRPRPLIYQEDDARLDDLLPPKR